MKAQLVRVEELLPCDRQSMYALLNTHFLGVQPEVFTADLAEKNWVLLFKDQDSANLKGFSTLLINQTEYAGKPLTIVFSGDTIMDPSGWSSSILARAWMATINKLQYLYAFDKLYWLLISSGYRTYRFLPVFSQEFYPRYDATTPEEIKGLMQFLSHRQFGDYYNQQTGIVQLPHPQVLRAELRDIPEERRSDPHIRFFAERNPGHIQGDELVCLAEISEANLTPVGRRLWFSESVL